MKNRLLSFITEKPRLYQSFEESSFLVMGSSFNEKISSENLKIIIEILENVNLQEITFFWNFCSLFYLYFVSQIQMLFNYSSVDHGLSHHFFKCHNAEAKDWW